MMDGGDLRRQRSQPGGDERHVGQDGLWTGSDDDDDDDDDSAPAIARARPPLSLPAAAGQERLRCSRAR